MAKILLTGGAGYIGSHTTIELLNAGHEVVIVDNFSNSKPEVLSRIREISKKNFAFYEADVTNKADLEDIFKAHTFDAVIHFAGLKAVGESVAVPLKYYQNNLMSTFVLCEVMQAFNMKKMVFSSSATVYGLHNISPLNEEMPLSATNPYGQTKLMIEQILSDVQISDPDWGIVCLRYFNPIGAHESGKIGEDPNGIPNNLMPYITQVASGKRDHLSVYGSDYETNDGTGVRDYIHVVDLAVAHVLAVESVLDKKGVEAYNIGTGIGYSVLDVVSTFEKATNVKVPYVLTDRRPGDIATCYADASKALKVLNWSAKRDLEEMCRSSWHWQKANPNGYEV
jgi:UDP-glucose 4-epimerase